MKKLLVAISLIIIIISGCSMTADNNKDMEAAKQESTSVEKNTSKIDSVEDSLLSPDRILNIAHRGASGHAPEHTIASYALANEMNGDYLEIDLQMTEDGELIAMHDSEVDRTTGGEGAVAELTSEDIDLLDAGEWFNEEHPDLAEPVFSEAKVPTLREIFETFGKESNYYIETKIPEESPGMVEELADVLEEYGMLDDDMEEGQIIIQSFSEASLREMHELEPSLPLIQLLSYDKKADITGEELDNINEYAIGIGANYKHISKEYVQKVRDAGLLVHPYTVNEKEDMERLIDWGVTGMFTNYPDRLNDVLDDMDSE